MRRSYPTYGLLGILIALFVLSGCGSGGGDGVSGTSGGGLLQPAQDEGPEIHIEKSTNGEDADDPPGPTLTVGEAVTWTYQVWNVGSTDLANVKVSDDQLGDITCPDDALESGAIMNCTAFGLAMEGQYQNVATAVANVVGMINTVVSDDDESHYLGVLAQVATIRGTVFEDLDFDGMFDAGEPGIPGVSVTLNDTSAVVTAGDGTYSFSVAEEGQQKVEETDPPGFISTTPNVVFVNTVIGEEQVVNFGDAGAHAVFFDMKPGSCPNPLNPKSQGVTPAAVMGTEFFDVGMINAASLLLEGVPPIRWNFEDAGRPYTGSAGSCFSCDASGPDGLADLALKFSTQDLVSAIGNIPEPHIELTLTGELINGTTFSGSDIVVIVPKKLAGGNGKDKDNCDDDYDNECNNGGNGNGNNR